MPQTGSNPTEDALKKKFLKPLDKPSKKCYNKDVPRGTDNKKKEVMNYD